MTVCYFDVDDEITSAVSRVRASDGPLVTLVLPAASRIATSRINFLILAREARTRGRTLAIVSSEAGVRALAVSAGLPSYPTVDESERALLLEDADSVPAMGPASPPDTDIGGSDWLPAGRTSRVDATGTSRRAPRGRPGDGDQPPLSAPASLWASAELPTAPDEGPAGAAPPGMEGRSSDVGSSDVGSSDVGSAGAGSAEALRTGASALEGALADAGRGTPLGAGPPAAQPPAAEPPPPGLLRTVDPRGVAPHSAVLDAGSIAAGTQTSARARAAEDRIRARRRVRRRVSVGARLVVALAILGTVAGAAYLYLPTATIALTPRTQSLGPVTVTVVAEGRVVDAARSRVPAERVDLPLTVSDEFPATGTAVAQTRATGSVRFTSENTLNDVNIPAGTRVSTAGGVAFTTRTEVVVPKASFATGPTTRDVDVQAAQAGSVGNVAAGAITRVPDTLSAQLLTVRNAKPTSGGRRTETKQVAKKDYDTALGQLTARLDDALTAALADPGTAPQGLTIYAATAEVADVRPDRTAADVVGTRGTSFTLTVSATGSVLGVDRALVAGLAVDQLKQGVPTGFRVLDDTIATTLDEPEVDGDTIRYTVRVQAQQWRPVDPATIVTAVRGRSLQEARTTLEQYGKADVSNWPDFIDSMPTQDFRITVAVREPSAP